MSTQKQGIKLLLLLGLVLAWWVATAVAQTVSEQAPIRAVDAIGMTVADMDRSLAFYTQVLAFTPVSDVEVTGSAYEHLQGVFGLRMRVVRLRLGDEALVLTEYLAPRGRPIPVDSRSHDRWFQHIAIIVSDMERAYGWLRQHKVEHAFYRDVLGLTVVGKSKNYGLEQEHLNNVFGARLRITTLRATAGPAIELLEYLAPRDGRPFPADARANDLVHWQTTLIGRDLEATAQQIRAGPFPLVSPRIVTMAASQLGFTKGILVRDPDGHVMQLIIPATQGAQR